MTKQNSMFHRLRLGGRALTAVTALALLATACGSATPADVSSAAGATTLTVDISESDADAETDTTVVASPTGQAVSSLNRAQGAVIQIHATGGFVEPDTGSIEGVGRGSGFFISDDGIAVTNNHVVGGAAFLEVFIGGDHDPVRARVLGVDECADLAVIQVEGDGYSYLDLYDGEIEVGTPVFAAGFPLGDPEYTLTSGIVSKASADGNTNWASVDAVIEHDARINPGNSGGPLLTEDGEVIGINYAGRQDTDQNFAITARDADTIIAEMRAGHNVDSLGINGSIISIGDVPGLWVSSLETGSPADVAGIDPGDFIVTVENIGIGSEGTMRRYCEAIRGQGAENQIAIEVLRPTTGEILAGNVNAEEELRVVFDPRSGAEATLQGEGTPYTEFMTLTDDTGQISLQVPQQWSQTITAPLVVSGVQFPIVIASKNIEAIWVNGDFNDDPNAPVAPGLVMMGINAAGMPLTPEGLLADMSSSATTVCRQMSTPEPFLVGGFEGVAQMATGCGVTADASVLWLAAQDPTSGKMMIFVVQLLTEADVRQVATILQSLRFGS